MQFIMKRFLFCRVRSVVTHDLSIFCAFSFESFRNFSSMKYSPCSKFIDYHEIPSTRKLALLVISDIKSAQKSNIFVEIKSAWKLPIQGISLFPKTYLFKPRSSRNFLKTFVMYFAWLALRNLFLKVHLCSEHLQVYLQMLNMFLFAF